MSRSEQHEKLDILSKINLLQRQGYRTTKDLNINDSIEEIEYEYMLLIKNQKRIEFYRSACAFVYQILSKLD